VGSSMLLTDRSSWRDRVLGALRLDAETYAEIAADDAATWQAFAVLAVSIVVASIPGGPDVGRIIGAGGPADPLVWGVALAFGALVGFGIIAAVLVVWAGLLAAIATAGVTGPETRAAFRRLRRALGFASAPYAFAALAAVPTVGGMLWIAVLVWLVAAAVVAIREALRVSTWWAIAAVVGSWLAVGALGVLFFVWLIIVSHS
jgi:hypothetical protein